MLNDQINNLWQTTLRNRLNKKKKEGSSGLREGSPIHLSFTISPEPFDVGQCLLSRFDLKIKQILDCVVPDIKNVHI